MEIKLTIADFFLKRRLLKIMMRTLIFLFCTAIFAITPEDVVSQNSKIKIAQDALLSIDEVFDLIREQTEYKFFYEEGIFENYKKVQVKKGIIKTNKLLRNSLSQGNLDVILTDNNAILIREKLNDSVKAQTLSVSGTITDNEGLPLAGVNIIEKGTSNGVQTDFDGNYTIKVSGGDAVLEVSYVGFTTQEIAVNARSVINISLKENTTNLDEVVVVAYGTVKRKNITSAQTTIKAATIENVPIPSLQQVLQGQIAGLDVRAVDGRPGASARVILRGRSSFNPNTNVEPLYVIDGIPISGFGFSELNNADIETLTVLKDASATAIYGNRGSNGVIIITTKKGGFGSKAKFSYSSQYGISDYIQPKYRLLDSRELLTYQRDNEIVSGSGFGLTDAEIDFFSQTNTDWSEFLLRQGATKSHELSFTAGGENIRNFTSLGYFEQDGIELASDFKRLSFRSNIDLKGDRFTLGTTVTLNFSRNSRPNTRGAVFPSNTFQSILTGLPYLSPFSLDGSINTNGLPRGIDNLQIFDPITGDTRVAAGNFHAPFVALNTARFDTAVTDNLRAILGLTGTYNLTDKLTAGTRIGVDYAQSTTESIIHPDGFTGVFIPVPQTFVPKGQLSNSDQRFVTVTWSNNLSYKNTFANKHNLEVGAYTEYFKQHLRGFNFTGVGIDSRIPTSTNGLADPLTDSAINPDPGDDPLLRHIPRVGNNATDLGLFSVFGLLRYNYDDKYNFSATLRRDATSRFSNDNEWGTFYSVSGRWNITKENWLKDSSWVNNLALRAGYGEVGNQDLGVSDRDAFASQVLFETGQPSSTQAGVTDPIGIGGSPGIRRANIANANVKWETKKSTNIGLDFSLFNSKLTGAIDVYRDDTEDILGRSPISVAATGFSVVNDNIGSLRNEGVELSLSYDIINNEDITWNVYANGAYNKNEVLALGNGLDFIDGESFGRGNGTFLSLQTGLAARTLYATRYVGVHPLTGDALLLDADGLLTTNANIAEISGRVFHEDKTFDPKYTGGFGTNFRYKGFEISSLFSYALEQYRINFTFQSLESSTLIGQGIGNASITLLDAWQQEGDITSIPRVGAINPRNTDRYLEDASFLRLRNLTVGYTFNAKQLKNTFNSIRFYLQGQNLFTWSKWRGSNPESTAPSALFDFPVSRIYTLGVNVNF
ncbi:SusC/RagA family TonB-linked outer membrane protein [Maribacter sp. 2304DJ31-5]|uniref:SusC/RagA family TonB-linked outer membrane protein n=1 Tax=Maribacter sp. 2304DJ31-5 TaxID=3386273 RepID=UPI0039BD02E0